MADTQRDIRVSDDSAEHTTESQNIEQAAAATVARLLANPRRIRRD